MSVLDKKLLLQDLEAQLNEYIPANTVKRILADAGNVLENYEVTTIIPDGGGSDESIQLIRLFVDAKAIEGKSPTTLARYEYVLRRLYEGVKVPLRRVTVYHLRQYMMAEKERGVALTTIKGNGSIYNAFYG